MAGRMSTAVLLVMLLFGVAAAVNEFKVGGKTGWAVPSGSEPETYDQWAQRLRFHIGDVLQFEYAAKQDSVLLVTRPAFENCNTTAPSASYDDGQTAFKLPHSGPFYFVSGAQGHCQKGQKLVVVVMAQGGRRRGSGAAAAAAAPAAGIAASPAADFGAPVAAPNSAPAVPPTPGSAPRGRGAFAALAAAAALAGVLLL